MRHSRVWIIEIIDTPHDGGEPHTWFAGPYGSTRANHTANALEATTNTAPGQSMTRHCLVHPLFSDDDCLAVRDYAERGDPGNLH